MEVEAMIRQPYVFITYCTHNQDHAMALRSFLQKHSVASWIAPYDIPGKENRFILTVAKAILECACAIVLVPDEQEYAFLAGNIIETIQSCDKPVSSYHPADFPMQYVYTVTEQCDGILRQGVLEEENEKLYDLLNAVEMECKKAMDLVSEGKTVTMGEYFYGEDAGRKPLEWIVLKEQDDKQLLLSKYVIDNTPYHSDWKVLSWRDCSLRTWLNTAFIEDAFTPEEASLFVESRRTKTRNIFHRTEDDPDCYDKVFLLSVEEVKEYLGTPDRIGAHPTPYAEEKGVFTSGYCLWWIRTPGDQFGMQAYINAGGKVTYEGCYQQRGQVGLRPAVWVKKK